MKIGKKTVLLGILVLLCSTSLGFMVQAQPADRTVINFTFTMVVPPEGPERLWFPSGGILMARNTPHYGEVTWSDTDFYGDIYYCGNIMAFLPDWTGVGGGFFDFTGYYGEGAAAGLYGRLNFEIENAYLTGTFNLHGTGAFEGKLLKGTFEGVIGGLYTGQLIIWN